ncbi:MAG: PAS domain S-box protein [Deltaproteobacteria bacterium]|nr:PAS domain S-box protein [Deltaproteobacteria bacterium]
MKILFINDNPEDQTRFKGVAGKAFAQVEVLSALSGESGVKLALAEEPDMILLDIGMPEIDGFKVCRRLKQDARARHIPIVFLTGLETDRQSRIKALEAGAEGFLAKPIDDLELIALTRAMVKIKTASKQRREDRDTELRRGEEKYRNIFNNAQVGIFRTRLSDGKVLECNERFARTYGYETPEACITDFIASEHYIDSHARQKMLDSLVEKGSVTDFEARFSRKDNTEIWTRFSARACPEEGYLEGIGYEITQEKKTLEALRRSEEKYRIILENMAEGYHEVDLAGRFTFINEACQKILGYSHEELGGISYQDYSADQENREKVFEAYNRVFKTGEPLRAFTWDIIRKDGVRRTIEVSCSLIRNEKNERTGFRGIVTDVTDRKRAEEALSKNQKLLAATQQLAKVGGWEWDVEAQAMTWTEEAYRIHDLEMEAFTPGSPEHIAGSLACYAPEDRSTVLAAFQRCIEHGEPYDLELPFTSAKGRRLWIRTTAKAVTAENRIVKVVGNIMDITELKQAEQNYQTLFREMLNGFALHEIVCDGEGRPADYRFLAVNPAFEEMTGLNASDILGKTVLQVFPGTEPRWIEIYGNVAQTGEPASFEDYSGELKKHFEVTAFRPSLNQFACIFADITERKRAEAERRKLQAQLNQAQKLEAVGRMAGGVAHDFNNMLAVILAHTELALMDTDPDDPIQERLQQIQQTTHRSADLVRQLLAFARKQTVAPVVLNLNDTVEGMLKILRRLIGEDIDLAWMPGAKLWPIKMDPSQIDQILANLCVNARDAIKDVGRIVIQTENIRLDGPYCSANPEGAIGDHVVLSVSDQGCGMEKEVLENLFEPFFTTKGVGKGTGLGLATVYGIVKQNEGFITVYSEPGEGATFRIYLPRHVGEATEFQQDPVEALRGGHETILVVEDELTLLEIGKSMLERLGYEVLVANTPNEAIRAAGNYAGEIHLLMTDVIMPEMNGRDLSDRLLTLYPNLKCLFTSGYTAEVITHHGVLDPGVHFIQKPFTLQALSNKLRQVLEEV